MQWTKAFIWCLGILVLLVSGTPQATAATTCTQKPIPVANAVSDGGYAWRVSGSFGTPADNSTSPTRSILRVFESGVALPYPHSLHADIRSLGRGRFSHYASVDGTNESIRLSALANTNVKTNGKTYTYCVPVNLAATITLPSTTYTANLNGTPVQTPVTVTTTAPVTKVTLSRDGYAPFATDTTAPYVFDWCATCFSATEPLPRTATLKATATAADGTVATATIVVTVKAAITNSISLAVAGAPNLPLNGTTALVTATVTGTQPSTIGLSRDGGAIFGQMAKQTNGTWTFTWCVSSSCWGGVTGSHTLKATATYADGSVKTASVALQVSDTTTTPPPTTSTLKTDFGVYPEPPLPVMGSRGSKIVDRTFGTTIMRVTDATDSAVGCGAGYSDKPLFNYNNTYLAAVCTLGYSRFKVFNFNSATLALSNGRIQANPPAGAQEYGIQWSHTNASKFYVVGLKTLYEVTIPASSSTTWTNTVVKDFSANFTGQLITQMSMSDNNDVFAFHYINNGVSTGYIVYKRSTNTILLNVSNEGTINEVEIDKSGRYLVSLKDSGALHVWDLQPATPVRTTVTTEPFNHRAMGNGIVVGYCSGNRLCKRNLSTPNSVIYLLPSGTWSYSNTQDHFSLTGPDGWMLGSRYTTNAEPVTKAFDQELVEVSTTGNGAVRRIAHHRSRVLNNAYPETPKASLSYDGQFAAFISNWGGAAGNNRRDLYLVKISPAP